MNNRTRYIKVTIEITAEVPANTTNDGLKRSLREVIQEAFWPMVTTPDQVEVVKIEDSIGVEVVNG